MSWIDDLPELPPPPTSAEDTTAIFVQRPARTDLAFDESTVTRDDHGHFATQAGDGSTHRDAARTLARISGKDAYVEDTPNTIAAAVQLAPVLQEMRAKGYTMPPDLKVLTGTHTIAEGPSGQTALYKPRPKGFTQYANEIDIFLPETLPAGANLDDACRVAFGGRDDAGHDKFTIRSMGDVLVHEMAHLQHGYERRNFAELPAGTMPFPRLQAATLGVSVYANTNGQEFVAEAFTRMYRGETLSADAMTLYHALKGPALR